MATATTFEKAVDRGVGGVNGHHHHRPGSLTKGLLTAARGRGSMGVWCWCMGSFGLKRSPFTEGSMRAYMLVGAVVAVALAAQAGTLRGDLPRETKADRVTRLIRQLGDDDFVKREAAGKEL